MGAFTLDRKGLALAIVLGLGIYYFGGMNYLLLILIFLILSTHITRIGYYEKRSMGVYEYERSWNNVLSNGIVPLLMTLLKGVVGPLPYIASIASITSDKFASEAGVFGGKPIEIFTFKEVNPGKSGAISLLGTFASFVGSIIIAILAIPLFHLNVFQVLIISLSGFIGSMADTVAGYFEERGLGNKSTSNIVGALVGSIIAYLLGGSIL